MARQIRALRGEISGVPKSQPGETEPCLVAHWRTARPVGAAVRFSESEWPEARSGRNRSSRTRYCCAPAWHQHGCHYVLDRVPSSRYRPEAPARQTSHRLRGWVAVPLKKRGRLRLVRSLLVLSFRSWAVIIDNPSGISVISILPSPRLASQ